MSLVKKLKDIVVPLVPGLLSYRADSKIKSRKCLEDFLYYLDDRERSLAIGRKEKILDGVSLIATLCVDLLTSYEYIMAARLLSKGDYVGSFLAGVGGCSIRLLMYHIDLRKETRYRNMLNEIYKRHFINDQS